jgi:hypothetical protein
MAPSTWRQSMRMVRRRCTHAKRTKRSQQEQDEDTQHIIYPQRDTTREDKAAYTLYSTFFPTRFSASAIDAASVAGPAAAPGKAYVRANEHREGAGRTAEGAGGGLERALEVAGGGLAEEVDVDLLSVVDALEAHNCLHEERLCPPGATSAPGRVTRTKHRMA